MDAMSQIVKKITEVLFKICSISKGTVAFIESFTVATFTKDPYSWNSKHNLVPPSLYP